MNDVCSFPLLLKNQNDGFGLIEALIALVILSTTILLMMSVALRQTNEARETLLLNQFHMQADALAELVTEHPANAHPIMLSWQTHWQQIYPKANIQTHKNAEGVSILIDVNHFSLKVVSDAKGSCSHKISRNDAG